MRRIPIVDNLDASTFEGIIGELKVTDELSEQLATQLVAGHAIRLQANVIVDRGGRKRLQAVSFAYVPVGGHFITEIQNEQPTND